jgi:GNAT superfamily N-acetyltransferase
VWWATGEAERHNPWFAHVLRTGSMMVAILEERVVGFAGYRPLPEAGAVSDCFVIPDYQGKGAGTALLKALLPAGRGVMTLASDDPKALSLYRRFGMTKVTMCDYLVGDAAQVEPGGVEIEETDRYPVTPADRGHLVDDLGCRFLAHGSTGGAAVTPTSVESSFALEDLDPGEWLTSVVAWLARQGSRKVEVQVAAEHPGHERLLEAGFEIPFRDTLMATPGVRPPDYRRLTFNGDILPLTTGGDRP